MSGYQVNYSYDAVGNRTSKTDSADPLFSNANSLYTYSYDPQNDRLLQVQRNATAYRTYTYDNAGRVSSVNGTAVTWSFDGQVASIGGTSFSYDGEGNRIGKTTGTTTTSYLVDPIWAYPQVAETDQGTTKTRMEWGIGLLKEGGSYTLSDGLDTLRALASTSGAVTSTATYLDAFGYPTNTGGQAFGLNGQVWDPETELYYLRARYYDPKTGRFISQDPYEGVPTNPKTLHRYTYGGDDPVNGIDPNGLYTQQDGYAVERAVQLYYGPEHPGEIYTYGQVQFYDSNGWLAGRGFSAGTRFRKPDIFNTTLFNYMEIKPFTTGGIASGILAMALNALAYGPPNAAAPVGFSPDVLWQPPNLVRADNGEIYYLINIDGVIFYTNLSSQARELATAAALALSREALSAILRGIATNGVGTAVARVPALATGSYSLDNARLQDMTAIGTLTAIMGLP